MTTKKPDSPFAQLEALRDKLPQGTRPATNPATSAAPKAPTRAVVRMERKQRGGKEVTVVEKLALPPDELARWCRELKQALGCGGSVEGDTIVLQGDLRSRLERLLQDRGVGRITIG
jgi:translation initiation factor 1